MNDKSLAILLSYLGQALTDAANEIERRANGLAQEAIAETKPAVAAVTEEAAGPTPAQKAAATRKANKAKKAADAAAAPAKTKEEAVDDELAALEAGGDDLWTDGGEQEQAEKEEVLELADIQSLLRAYVAAKDIDAAKQVFADQGVAKASELDPSKYAEVAAILREGAK